MVTFRRDGRPVATPVWAAVADGRAYVRAERESGKVKRLPPLEAHGRILAPAEEHAGERALAERYGLGRASFERTMDLLRVDMCYLEFAQAGAAALGSPAIRRLEEEMAETPTLYVCHGDDGGPRMHPCRRVQEALRAAGIEYEKVIAAHGNPIPFLRKGSREELRAATGTTKLPTLKLADGTVITPSRKILDWIGAQS